LGDGLDSRQVAQYFSGAINLGIVSQLKADFDRCRSVAEGRSQFGYCPLPDHPAGRKYPDPVAHRLDLGQQVARQEDGQSAFVDQGA